MAIQRLWQVCVLWLLACSVAAAASDPGEGVRRAAQALRKGDLRALLVSSMPPSQQEGMEDGFRNAFHRDLSAADRAEFDRGWRRLLEPDGVDAIMLELTPQLEALRPQLAMMISMGIGMAGTALEDEPADAGEAQLQRAGQQALDALQPWALRTDFTDPERVRVALEALARAARRTGIQSSAELESLHFDEILAAGSVMLVGIKQAAKAFELDLDAIAASTQVQVLQQSNRHARVQTRILLFGAPVHYETELLAAEGGWYPREVLQAGEAR